MNRWYRAYEGTVSDPKLGEVAILAEASRSIVVATWHSILESCASANDGGRIDTNHRRVAAILGEPVALVERVFAGLKKVGMMDGRSVTSWRRRQFESDSSTERSRKHRQRKDSVDATLQQRDATPPETETETETEKIGGGSVTPEARLPTKKPSAIPNGALIEASAGPLFKQFQSAYRGPCGKPAERKFRALLLAGENADPIIAAAHRANPEIPAEQWLDERAWAQLSLLPDAAPKPLISPEAMTLGDEIALIAGQDLKFLEPGWCGAAWRCQQWLDQGWPRELIVAGVKAMVTQKAPEKIGGHAYFDKGLARFIAQQTRPVPKVIEHQAQTVEVTRAKPAVASDPRSLIQAIDGVYDRIEQVEH